MKITILGNNGPFPKAGGACSSYLVEQGQSVFLLDCGSGAVEALQQLGQLSRVQAVVLSHLHFDHLSDLLMLQYALAAMGMPQPLPVYAPAQPESVFSFLKAQPMLAVTAVEPGQSVTVNGVQLDTCAGVHPVPSLAYRLTHETGVFVYSGDTNEAPALAGFAQGADLLLCDAGLMEADWSAQAPHLSALRAGRLAQAAGVHMLLLTHLGPMQSPEAAVAEAQSCFAQSKAAQRLTSYDGTGQEIS